MNGTATELASLPGLGIKPLLSLRRHPRTALWAFIVILILGTPLALLKGRSYYIAQATFQVSPSYMKNMETDKELELQSNSQYREYVNHLSRMVVRYDILESALDELHQQGVELRPPALTKRQYIEQLQRRIYVRAIPDTYMVHIGTEDARSAHLHTLVNAVADTFVRTVRSEQIYGSGERIDTLKTREHQLHEEIEALSAARLVLADRLHLTTFADSTANPYDTILLQMRERLALATSERVQAEAALDAYMRQKELPMHLGRSLLESRQLDNGLQALRNEVVKRSEELHRTLAGLEPRHPAYQAAQAELLQIQRRLKGQEDDFDHQASDNARTRLMATLATRMQVEREARAAVDRQQAQAADFASSFQEAMRLTTDIRKRDADLTRLRERLGYLETESRALGWVRLVSRALPAETPQGIGRKRMLLMALLAALAAAALVPVALDVVDARLRTVNDAEKLLGLPAAGWQVRRDGLATDILWREQGRRFAATLLRNRGREGRTAYAFTGVKSGAGVSELVMDTAQLLLTLGARPLVVRADARHMPGETRESVGLSDYLAGDVPLRGLVHSQAWRETELPCVSIGTRAHQGLQRLDLLREALQHWQQDHDFILLDLPPLLLNADAELTIEAVGQVFLVVEADAVSRGEALRAKRLLEKLQPEAVGLFVNKVAVFQNSGYMQQLIVETATRARFDTFMSLSYWRLQAALWRVRYEQWRRSTRGKA
ncbi:hypothetical protein H5407_17635 [Mitsuaria sp. WAJ17]|uniref:hypothetical protein n=1 Tax=Mitsuaria sp. WAJ17 TaxID=2761452 RepID=UPI00160295C9|nr:hypothetical protein [Mitsuaria sp. WAJ17]MBB2487055.1 hypothetical protein [Mitsuaria sp. WAJ17]